MVRGIFKCPWGSRDPRLRGFQDRIFHGGGSGDRAQHAGTHRQSDAGYSVSWCVKVAHRRHEGPGAGHRDGGIQERSGPRGRRWILWGGEKIFGETRGIGGRCGYLSQVGSIPKSPDDSERRIYVPPGLPPDLPDLRPHRVRQVRRRHAGRKDEAGEPRHAGAESGRLREDQLSGTFRLYPVHREVKKIQHRLR